MKRVFVTVTAEGLPLLGGIYFPYTGFKKWLSGKCQASNTSSTYYAAGFLLLLGTSSKNRAFSTNHSWSSHWWSDDCNVDSYSSRYAYARRVDSGNNIIQPPSWLQRYRLQSVSTIVLLFNSLPTEFSMFFKKRNRYGQHPAEAVLNAILNRKKK